MKPLLLALLLAVVPPTPTPQVVTPRAETTDNLVGVPSDRPTPAPTHAAPKKAAPEQPIPAEKIRALYPEVLEIQRDDALLKLQQQALQQRNAELTAKVRALALGVNLNEWAIDWKSGKMVKR
jgi:hypothetical protein